MKLALWWVAFYPFAVVLAPPVLFHGKSFYLAEILLIPLAASAIYFAFLKKNSDAHAHPPVVPRALFVVALASLAAFLSGYFRGETGTQLSIYPLPADGFSLNGDGIAFLRWLIIFCTPWIVMTSLAGTNGSRVLPRFTNSFRIAVFVSALMALGEKFHLISLVNLGYHADPIAWQGRVYGTFSAPLEGSLVYGAATAFEIGQLLGFARKQKPTFLSLAVAVVSFFALVLTLTGTAFVCLLGTILILLYLKSTPKTRRLGATLIAGAVAIVILTVSKDVFRVKINDLLIRSQTWAAWFRVLLQKPWILITGIGFSKLIVDSSVFTILIKGGLFLLTSVFLWMKNLSRAIPIEYMPVFIFWGISFLTLDSIGYWGLGRLCWVLFGLFVFLGQTSDRFGEKNP